MNNHYNNLINYIDELIDIHCEYEDEGYFLNIQQLDDDELGKLSYLFLELNNRDTYEFFIDSSKDKNDEVTCALIKLLQDNSYDNQQDLSNLIFKQSIQFCKPFIQIEIDNRCAYQTNKTIGKEQPITHGYYENFVFPF